MEKVMDDEGVVGVEGEGESGAEERGAEGREDEEAREAPVSESIRYRLRAQAAEKRLREVESECRAACEALATSERGREMDRLLVEAETVDLEAARLLTEAAVMAMDETDVGVAVEELRRRKPYLFGRRGGRGGGSGGGVGGGGVGGGAMAARGRAGVNAPVEEAAEAASVSGSRRDLLRYLRLRRNPG